MHLGIDEKSVRLLNEAAGRKLARDDKGAIVIEGNLILQGTPLTSLPDDLRVTGLLDLCGAHTTALPENLTVGGDLILACAAVTSLPRTLRVGRNLRFNHSAIAALPDDLAVSGSLDLTGTPIAALPENLTVSGDLLLSHTAVTSLPATLRVGGSLNLTGTPIASLPENLTVGGYLSLTGTAITALPKNLSVGSDLYLQGTAITSLPENLTVGGCLCLHGTAVTSLSENLTVGRLDLTDTPITSLPENLTVRGDCHLMRTALTSLPQIMRVGGNLYITDPAITTVPPGITRRNIAPLNNTAITRVPLGPPLGVLENVTQEETRTSLTGTSLMGKILMGWSWTTFFATARDPADRLKRLLDDFDSEDEFALWVAEPALAAKRLRRVTPQWGAKEHARWDDLLHSLGAWKGAARPGGGFPLRRDGAALGFEVEVRNQEAAEVRTPHTTSWERAREYLEQARGYFRRNAEWFRAGYYWNMHLNLSLTEQERANAGQHLDGIGQVCRRLLTPNNPFGRNVYTEARLGRVYVHGVPRDPRCPERKDAARLEMKEAAVHADLDVGYLFVCLDVVLRLIQAPERLGPALGRLERLYQRYGLPAEFEPSASAEAEVVRALLFERAAADFRRAVKHSNGGLVLEDSRLEN